MKQPIILILFFLSIFFLISNEKVGEVSLIEGDVFITRDKKKIEVAVGDNIFNSDVIQTENNSIAEITLTQKYGKLRIKEDSKLVMNHFVTEEQSQFSISLFFGNIINSIIRKKSDSNEIYNITTPTITLGVRGTEFEVVVTETGDTLVEVGEGEVVVGEINEEGEFYSDKYQERINNVTVGKGESVERLMSGSRILKKVIDKKQWAQERIEYLKENPGKVLVFLGVKTIILGKKIEKLNRANIFLTMLEKKINEKSTDAEDKIKKSKVLSKGQKNKILKEVRLKSKKARLEVIKQIIKLLKINRILLDEFWSTKGLMVRLTEKIKDEKIIVKDKEILIKFRKKIEMLKKIEKDVVKAEILWRSLVKKYRKK